MKKACLILFIVMVVASISTFAQTEKSDAQTIEALLRERDTLRKLVCETRIANVAKCEALLRKMEQQNYQSVVGVLTAWMDADLKTTRSNASNCPLSDDGRKALERASEYLAKHKQAP